MEIEKDKNGIEICDAYVLNGRLVEMLLKLSETEIKNVLIYLLINREIELSAAEYAAVDFIDYVNDSYNIEFDC